MTNDTPVSPILYRGIVQGNGRGSPGSKRSVNEDLSEMANFFRQATSSIVLTTKNINKLDKCDAQFTFYCLQLLIPSLTTLFQHVGLHKVGDLLIDGSIRGQCRYIFQNLVDLAVGTGPVYVGRYGLKGCVCGCD